MRTSRPQQLVLLVLGGLTTLWLLVKVFGGSSGVDTIPAGTPKAVIVTTLDPGLSPSYKEAIKANRRHYASKHGTQLAPAHCGVLATTLMQG